MLRAATLPKLGPLALSVIGLVLPVQVIGVLVTASIAPESLDLTTSETGVSRGEETEFLLSQLTHLSNMQAVAQVAKELKL